MASTMPASVPSAEFQHVPPFSTAAPDNVWLQVFEYRREWSIAPDDF